MKRTWVLWLSAIIITILAAYYQRIMGPSYALISKINIGGSAYRLQLPRSNEGNINAEIKFNIPDTGIKAILFYRHYSSDMEYIPIEFNRKENFLVSRLPNLNAGGKFEYFIELQYNNVTTNINKEKPVIIRYRDYVPQFIMIPHIILMFLAMMFSNLTGIMVFLGKKNVNYYSILTFFLLFTGGIFFGCIVQKLAFGEYWTGVPFGWDLTDNKTLIAVITWAIALISNIKKERPHLLLLASIVMLAIFLIPHSLYGTEKLITTNIK